MSNYCRELLFNPAWQTLYAVAMSMSGNGMLRQAVSDAEDAVLARMRELSQRCGSEVQVERDELEDALYILRALKNSEVYASAA